MMEFMDIRFSKQRIQLPESLSFHATVGLMIANGQESFCVLANTGISGLDNSIEHLLGIKRILSTFGGCSQRRNASSSRAN
jgi:hypothetical protein